MVPWATLTRPPLRSADLSPERRGIRNLGVHKSTARSRPSSPLWGEVRPVGRGEGEPSTPSAIPPPRPATQAPPQPAVAPISSPAPARTGRNPSGDGGTAHAGRGHRD